MSDVRQGLDVHIEAKRKQKTYCLTSTTNTQRAIHRASDPRYLLIRIYCSCRSFSVSCRLTDDVAGPQNCQSGQSSRCQDVLRYQVVLFHRAVRLMFSLATRRKLNTLSGATLVPDRFTIPFLIRGLNAVSY